MARRLPRLLCAGLLAAAPTIGLAVAPASPASAACTVSRTYRLGARATAVHCIEVRLKTLGYQTRYVDYYYGLVTVRAVKRFQTASSLPVSGVVDQATAKALGIWVDPPSPDPLGLVRRAPLAPGVNYSFGTTHSSYPAADIFAACGAPAVAPVTGTVAEVRTENLWVAATDNPAHRGGRYVAILGDDGARYYMAHFASVRPEIVVGARVSVGDPIAAVGRSGRAGSCHIHFGLSMPCPGTEWRVRRGVIWPQRYLTAWRRKEILSPVAELTAWFGAHPSACEAAMADATAADA